MWTNAQTRQFIRALDFFYKYVGPAFCVTDLKIDMKVVDVGAMSWAGIAYDSIRWMSALKKNISIQGQRKWGKSPKKYRKEG